MKILNCFLLLLFIHPALAQLTIDDHSYSQEALIQKLSGKGVKISNIKFDCPSGGGSSPYGYFQDNTGTLGIESGLIMTSGAAKKALGPNNSSGAGQDNGHCVDHEPDLSDLLTTGDKVCDVCKIEFDIVVENDLLLFSYVFGSEEYPEWVANYHDVFGFFISGPGIIGSENLAVLPNSGLPVDVHTVNDTNNPQFYISNGTGAFPELNIDLQYDGYTTVLQASANVIPCQTYHLKLAIGDVRDNILDAGVFIENKSIQSVQSVTTKVIYEHPQYNTAIEGCNKAYVVFKRNARDNRQAIPLRLKVGGTATPIADYLPVETNITIPAGKDSVFLTIDALRDAVKDPGETVQLVVLNNCPNIPPQDSVTVTIEEEFKLKLPAVRACAGDSVQLNVPSSNNYAFVWDSTGGLSCLRCSSPYAKGRDTTFFPFTATDISSGCLARDSAVAIFLSLPFADFTFSEDSSFTSQDIDFKNLSVHANSFQWDFGDQNSSQEFSPSHHYVVPSSETEVTFTVTLVSSIKGLGCSDTISKKVLIKPIFIPNLVTVNGDNRNDQWELKGIHPGSWKLSIYNRWGGVVYQTDQFSSRWDPVHVTSGIYYYLLRSKEREFHGWIQVIK